MRTHVALLRGINLGGRNRVEMARLREVVTELGHRNVATYIRSGNVVFDAAGPTEPEALAGELERAIAERLEVRPAVVVLFRAEFAAAVRDNPFPDEPDPRCLHAVFLPAPPSAQESAALAATQRAVRATGSRDAVTAVGRVLYLHTPDGFGRSELAAHLTRPKRGAASGTARNWVTVTRLLALLDE